MPTTANYSWPTPADTDLVKLGAEAIRDLGDAIDTTVFANSPGLVHINETTMSAVASQSINDVFTSTYDNYLIIFKITSTTGNGQIFMKMRAAGTNASSNYEFALLGFGANASTSNADGTGSTSGMYIMSKNAGVARNAVTRLELFSPALAQATRATLQISGNETNAIYFGWSGMGTHKDETAYDGADFISNTGNITGSITIFAFRKS